jgi:outer membrane protein
VTSVPALASGTALFGIRFFLFSRITGTVSKLLPRAILQATVLVVALAATGGRPAFAERKFTLSAALQTALERNPSTLEARYRYEGALAAAGLTEKTLFGTKLTGNLQWTPDQRGLSFIGSTLFSVSGSTTVGSFDISRVLGNGDSISFRFSENRIFRSSSFGGPPEPSFLNELSLTYNRPLLTARRKIPAVTLSAAQLDGLAAYWAYAAQSNQVAQEVAHTFAEWVRARNLVRARKAALDESELTLKSTSERVRLGAAAPLERDFAESSYYQRELDYNAARTAFVSARDSLEALLQATVPEDPPDDWDDLSSVLSAGVALSDRDASVPVDQAPAVLNATLSAQSARRRAVISNAQQRRNLNLYISLSGQGAGKDYPRAWETFRYGAWFVGLQYDESIGALPRQREASEKAVAAAAELLRGTISQVRLQLKQGYRNLTLSESQVKSARAAVYAAESALKGARARYEVGMGVLLDVLKAEADLLNARLALIDAEHNRILALVSIASLNGTLVSPATAH